jgi:hypothetical protein
MMTFVVIMGLLRLRQLADPRNDIANIWYYFKSRYYEKENCAKKVIPPRPLAAGIRLRLG